LVPAQVRKEGGRRRGSKEEGDGVALAGLFVHIEQPLAPVSEGAVG